MAKHVITQDCEYIKHYPFCMLEAREGNEVFTEHAGEGGDLGGGLTVQSQLGKLPLLSRRGSYAKELNNNGIFVCNVSEDDPSAPDHRAFCLYNGPLRVPAHTDEPPPDADIVNVFAIFFNVDFSVALSTIFGCKCDAPTFFGMIIGGEGGTHNVDPVQCTEPTGTGCSAGNAQSCLDDFDKYTGFGSIKYNGSITFSTVNDQLIEKHDINVEEVTACVDDANREETRCETGGDRASADSQGTVCSLPGQLAVSISATIAIVTAKDILPSDWEDDLVTEPDGTVKWNGWTVINPP